MITILPATWESPYVTVTVEDLTEDYLETGGVFRTEEAFVVDNGDGTFSLYVGGQFVEYVDDTHDVVNWLPVRRRERS